MEKNYYEILEVDKNASPEIIEKSYKTLVKKYHPDLHDKNSNINFEEKIKEINEAYEILSDDEKRKNYNLILKNNEVSIDDYQELYKNYNILYNENILLKKELNNYKNINLNKNNFNYNNQKNNNINNNFNHNNLKNNNINNNFNYNNLKNNNINNNFNYNNLKNKYYKIKNNKKNIFKNFFALFLTLLILLFCIFIFLNIPFTRQYLINLYNENSIFRTFINLIIK